MSLEQVERLQEKIPRLHNLHHRGISAKSLDNMEDDVLTKYPVLPTPPPLLSKLKKKISIWKFRILNTHTVVAKMYLILHIKIILNSVLVTFLVCRVIVLFLSTTFAHLNNVEFH